MNSKRLASLAPVLWLLLGACQTTWYGARFSPVANEVVVDAEQQPGQARALMSVRGVRRAQSGEPAQVEMRMRLENTGDVPFHLQQGSLELLSGDLVPFGAARILSEDPPRVEPRGAAVLDLSFPVPAGRDPDEVDFGSLHLRFSLDFDGEVVTTRAQFERRSHPYYDYGYPYPYYRSRFFLGYGYYGW